MKVNASAIGDDIKYSITDLNEATLKLIRKSLTTNYYYNNFQTDYEEDLCIDLTRRIATIAA